MPRPKAHSSLPRENHQTAEARSVELIELPFCEQRRFRLRVNRGAWAKQVPTASQTFVVAQMRAWLVKH